VDTVLRQPLHCCCAAALQAAAQKGVAHFLEEVVKPVLAMEGDRLPVR
jgi:hypothetical protein